MAKDAQARLDTKRYNDALDILNPMEKCSADDRRILEELKAQVLTAITCSKIMDETRRLSSSIKSNHDRICSKLADYDRQCNQREKDIRIENVRKEIGECNLTPDESDELIAKINIAIGKKDFEEARRLHNDISEKFPFHPEHEALAKMIREEMETHRLINEIHKQVERKNFKAARKLYSTFSEKYPDHPEREALAKMIRENPPEGKGEGRGSPSDGPSKKPPPENPKSPDAKEPEDFKIAKSHIEDADRYFRSRDFNRARESARNALKLKPGDRETMELINQINESALEERAKVRQAIQEFYEGRYDESYRQLDDLISSGASPQVAALGEFYMGANDSIRFLFDGGRDLRLKKAAEIHFRNSVSVLPKFIPPSGYVSERVIQHFREATYSDRSK